MEKKTEEHLLSLVIKLKDYIKSCDSIISLQDKFIKELTESLKQSKLDNKKQFAYNMYVGIAVFVVIQIIFNLLIK